MKKIEEGKMHVPAIKNGSVIDHIPVDQLPKVVAILNLYASEYPLTIGQNFKSKKLGKKGLIKVEEKFFTPEEVNTLALVCPDIVINVIRDYDVVEKIRVQLPDRITGLVRCTNPKCITNNEPMQSDFEVLDKKQVRLKCNYCTRKIEKDEVELTHYKK